MNYDTEELLNEILWLTELLKRPSWLHLGESYESWAYRHGLLRRMSRMKESKLVTHHGQTPARRAYHLTEHGRRRAWGGRDPVAQWARPWDGRWRWVSFDVPEVKASVRQRLRYFLRDHQFGKLQRSLWLTPDATDGVFQILRQFAQGANTLVIAEGRPISGDTNQAIVAAAWDFAEINRGYEDCLRILNKFVEPAQSSKSPMAAVRQWMRQEHEAWLAAVSSDPLLPSVLLPPGYLGQQVWQKRQEILPRATKALI